MPTDWAALARRAARKARIDEDLFEAQMRHESANYDPDVITGRRASSAGALGIAQMMPDTARGWGVDPLNPRQALARAAQAMAEYEGQYGSYKDALIAYNAGPGRVGKPLYDETRKYIDIIMGGRSSPKRMSGTDRVNRPSGQLGRVATASAPQQPTGPNLFTTIAQQMQTSPVNVGITGSQPQQLQQPTQQNGLQQGQQHLNQLLQKNWSMMGQIHDQMSAARQAVSQGVNTPQTNAAMTQEGNPEDAPRAVREMFEEAARIDKAKLPYSWGGGHDRLRGPKDKLVPLDCSGAVSQVLGLNPRVSGAFEKWGAPGEGEYVTVYANAEHVLMKINGRFWGTSKANPGGGAGWIPSSAISDDYLSRFVKRHPQGM